MSLGVYVSRILSVLIEGSSKKFPFLSFCCSAIVTKHTMAPITPSQAELDRRRVSQQAVLRSRRSV